MTLLSTTLAPYTPTQCQAIQTYKYSGENKPCRQNLLNYGLPARADVDTSIFNDAAAPTLYT